MGRRKAPKRRTALTAIKAVRTQIGKGADWIKVYADYRWGKGRAAPTFSLDELKLIVETARSAGVPSPRTRPPPKECEGRRWPALRRSNTATTAAGSLSVDEREGSRACPTLSVGNQARKKDTFQAALAAGVTISLAATRAFFRTATARAS